MSYRSWFTTPNGRALVGGLVTFSMGSVLVCKYTPHTFFIDKYTDIFHLYKSGFKATLPDDFETKFKKCIELLKIPKIYKEKIRAFPVCGFDLFHAGFFDSWYGVSIGVPQTFLYNSVEDIDKDSIQVNLQPVSWSSDAGQLLVDSLILTEKEQQFGMCREILMTWSKQVYIDSISPVIIMFTTYIINQSFNHRLKLFSQPPIVRGVLYTITSVFGLGLYFFCKDFTQVQYEISVDKQLCDLGPEFIEAGVGFYTKLLNKNIALRELTGKSGEKVWTKHGNENSLIRFKNLPLTIRKSYFEMKLKELENKPEEEMDSEHSQISDDME